jgi:ABC-type multidrug transport system fused ATPase/permease subunit
MNSDIKKLLSLIDKNDEKRVYVLSFMLFLSVIIEVTSLGLLFPTIGVILDSSNVSDSFIFPIFQYFNIYNVFQIKISLIILIIFLFLFKTIFMIIITFFQSRFLSQQKADLSIRLFILYLKQNYIFHLNSNSSLLYKNIHTETWHVNMYITALIQIIVESSLVISVFLILIIIEPLGTIFISILLGLSSFLFFKKFKNRIGNWGEKSVYLNETISKLTLESYSGIRELILYNKLNSVKHRYESVINSRAEIEVKHQVMSQLPRFFIELIGIVSIMALALIMLLQSKTSINIISVASVFVAGTFRMMPSFNRIITSLQNLRFFKEPLNLVYNEFINLKNDFKINECEDFSFKNKINFKNVSFGYNNKKTIFEKINISISHGKTIGIIGESGAGKSTFVSLLTGLIEPSKGEIFIDDFPIKSNVHNWQNLVGYVPQSIFLLDDSILNNITLENDQEKIDFERVNKCINDSQLNEFVNSLPDKLDTVVGEKGSLISGGQLQRIGIARALYSNPSILILDEASSALDSKTEKKLMDLVYDELSHLTKIIISHNPKNLLRCDLVYEIKNGDISEKFL